MNKMESVIIFKSSKTERNKKIEETESLTNEEIAEASKLFKRNAWSKENPLDEKGKARLEELNGRIEKEKDAFFPKFDFEKIVGFGTPNEASAQFDIAEKYFKRIAELAKTPLNSYNVPEGIYNLALNLEKLKNLNRDPKRIEEIFLNLFLERRKAMLELHKMAVEGEKNASSGQGVRFRDMLLDKLRSGKITKLEMKNLEKAMGIERGYIMRKIPDYLREAVIYAPDLAEEAKITTREIFYMPGRRKKELKTRINYHKERIEILEAEKRKKQ